MTNQFRRATFWSLALACIVAVTSAAALESPAKRILLLDATTNTVLFEKRADEPAPPASMSKLMTLYMLFERLADGGIEPHRHILSERKGVADGRCENVRSRQHAGYRRGFDTRNCRAVRK